VIAAAEEHGALRDRAVEVRTPSGTLRGRVLGLSAAGGLVVETEDAVRVTVTDSSATVRLI
jgi:biotin-(acetyl-CoA carboxylase) ligase